MNETIVEPKGEIEFTTITPAIASQLLARNKVNRRIRTASVNRYADDMKAKLWRPRAATAIMLDSDGYLVNGQHRCHACLQAGVPFDTYIIRGVDRDDLAAVDGGVGRSLGDLLNWRGEVNPRQLAAAIRIAFLWESGVIASRWTLKVSSGRAIDWLAEHPGFKDSLTAISGVEKSTAALPLWVASSVHYFASKVSPIEVQSFFDGIRSGANLQPGSPILALTRVIAPQRNNRARRMPTLLAVTIKALEAHRQGRAVEKLSWSGGRAKNSKRRGEKFPVAEWCSFDPPLRLVGTPKQDSE